MPSANSKKSLNLTQTSVLEDTMLFVHHRNILLNWNNYCRIGVLQILTILSPVQSSSGSDYNQDMTIPLSCTKRETDRKYDVKSDEV